KESEPLLPEKLELTKEKLKTENFNWLYLSVWLGLRPLEVDQLKNPELFRILTDTDNVRILWVYQTKLVSVPHRYRWKLIPLIFDEQKKCLEIIEANNFMRPL